MTFGSLFAGIGGFDLGFERAGMTPKWQVEIDPFCQAVLAKHWPSVRRYSDVRQVHAAGICGTGTLCLWCAEPVDVLCGGFPCQDISVAGRGDGINGARSGLWSEFARLIRELRPSYVVVENVSALLSRGLGRVLGDLAACGYDAEWDCLPASAFGAPHQRDRLWLVAHAASGRRERWRTGFAETGSGRALGVSARSGQDVADAESRGQSADGRTSWQAGHADISGANVAHANSLGTRRDTEAVHARKSESGGRGGIVPDADRSGRLEQWRAFPIRAELASAECRDWWLTEPDVGRVAHGIPARVDRLRGLGNAVVPQITEYIGRRLMQSAQAEI